jgi:hypothetical protein
VRDGRGLGGSSTSISASAPTSASSFGSLLIIRPRIGCPLCDENGTVAFQGQDITGFGFSTTHAASVTFSVYATMDAGEETPYKYPR